MKGNVTISLIVAAVFVALSVRDIIQGKTTVLKDLHCLSIVIYLKMTMLSLFTSRNEGYVFIRVCDSVHGGGSASVHAGIPPPPPGKHAPQKHAPQKHAPREACTPPGSTHPQEAHTPLEACTPWEADSGIRSMSGRYASYWNAFLLKLQLQIQTSVQPISPSECY